MKKTILILLLSPFFCYSQITVTSYNLPNIGDTVIIASDFANYTPGNSGANQNWNFSNVAGTPDMMLGFIDPLMTPYYNNFPNSNVCVKLDSATYYYLDRSTNGLSSLGFVDMGMSYPYAEMLLPTPLNYLDTIINTQVLFEWDTLLSPPLPAFWITGMPGPYTIDSVKVISGSYNKHIVDGWGQIQLPNGTFDALRIFETSLQFDNTSYKMTDTILGTSQWVQDPANAFYWEGSRYSWRTNDSLVKWKLAEIETDSLGNSYGELIYYLGNSINYSPDKGATK